MTREPVSGFEYGFRALNDHLREHRKDRTAIATARQQPHYRRGRYLLRLPGEAKATERTRATTFIKALDDESNLAPWLATMAVVGVMRSTAIRTRWAELLTTNPDPWYDGGKDQAKKLCIASQSAGGADERRDIGTALHGILKAVSADAIPISNVPVEWRAHVANVIELLDANGFDIVPQYCERSIYNAKYNLVGTFDLLLYNRITREYVTGDYKTGGETWRPYLHRETKQFVRWVDGYDLTDLAHCVQMAIYNDAQCIIDWPFDEQDECTVEPMPTNLNKDMAVIVHVPATEPGNVSLRLLNLEKGRLGADVAHHVIQARKLKPLVRRIGATEPSEPRDAITSGERSKYHSAPTDHFDPPPRATELPPQLARVPMVYRKPVIDEGPPAINELETLRSLIAAFLNDEQRQMLNRIATEAKTAGYPISIAAAAPQTERRFVIVTMLYQAAMVDRLDDESLRDLIGRRIGDQTLAAVLPLGHLVGSLTIHEAAAVTAVLAAS